MIIFAAIEAILMIYWILIALTNVSEDNIDGANQDTIDSKAVVPETETESAVIETSTESSTTDSTDVSENNESVLVEKIKDKIIDRYPDAVITNFDVVSLSGSFTTEGNSYEFSWTSDMLEVDDVNDSDNVVFYKVIVN